jgi:hypothetical protein
MTNQTKHMLVITITGDSIAWKPETHESLDWAELDADGTYYLNASTDLPQIVSPESVGITEEQIREWAEATDAFYAYTDSRGATLSDEEEVVAGNYEREMVEKEKAMTAAIREVYDALVAAGRAAKDETTEKDE